MKEKLTLQYICAWLIVAAMLVCGGIGFAQAPSAQTAQTQSASPARKTNADIARTAQTIFVRSKSNYFKASALENELLKRDEFNRWNMAITRDEADADLVIEVGRKVFTTKFVFSVIDPRTQRVITSGKINSIGGTVEDKIADRFITRIGELRAAPSQ